MSGNPARKVAFNYFGGKINHIDFLVENFPPVHYVDHYFDHFAGSFAVTLNIPRYKIMTANDRYGLIVNFFKVLRERPADLVDVLRLTPYARDEFYQCLISDDDTDLEKARKFFVTARQSFASLGAQDLTKGWAYAKTKSYSNICDTISRWVNSIEFLPEIADKLLTVQIENKDFRETIPTFDFKGAFHYCDPPYVLSTRSEKSRYKYEMQDKDHEEMAELLRACKGYVAVSGYPNKLYNKLYKDWYFVKAQPKKNNMRNTEVQECLWMNYDPAAFYHQSRLEFK